MKWKNFTIFFLFVILLKIFQLAEGNTKYNVIQCHQSYFSPSNCVVKETENLIWPDDDHITAAAPTSLKVNWFAGKDKRDQNVVLFNITWTQRKKYFFNYVQGFLLSISSLDYLDEDLKNHVFFQNKTALLNWRKIEDKKVHFVYDEFGWNDSVDFIFPGSTYIIKIQSIPLYHENSDPMHFKAVIITIPDCSNVTSQIRLLENCKNIQENENDWNFEIKTTTSSITEQKRSTNTRVLVVFIVIGAFFLLSISLIFLFKRKWKKMKRNEFKPKQQHLMFVNSSCGNHKCYEEITSRLASYLRDYGSIDICCNLWERSKIHDPFQWLSKKIPEIDHIIFFLTPTSGDSFITLSRLEELCEYNLIAKTTKKSSKIRITVVHCDQKLEKIKYPKFKIMEQFKVFFESVTGRRVRNNIPPSAVDALSQLVTPSSYETTHT